MPFRVTNASMNARLTMQISTAQQRVANAQEQVSTGKRINMPSDDPAGAQRVLQVRAKQATIDQFRRSADTANGRLTAGDTSLTSYEQILDRTRTLLSQAASSTTPSSGRANIATELEGIKSQIISLGNSTTNGEYVFGGTRQDAPPFDPTTGAFAGTPSVPQRVQIESSSTAIQTGVTAESVFSDANGSIVDTLNSAITALRGTADPANDTAVINSSLDRLADFTELAGERHTIIGSNLGAVQSAQDRLNSDYLSLESTANQIEGADASASILALTESSNALNAILQSSAFVGRKSLIDFLG